MALDSTTERKNCLTLRSARLPLRFDNRYEENEDQYERTVSPHGSALNKKTKKHV